MIFTAIVGGLLTIFMFVISLIPSLPQMPTAVSDIGTFLVNFLGGSWGFVVHIYTPTLAGAIFAMVLALIFFEQGYMLVMFILHKLKLI